MGKFSAIIGFVKTITKYGGIVFLVIQTFEFFTKGLEELENPKKEKKDVELPE